jgi:hypothetical protein
MVKQNYTVVKQTFVDQSTAAIERVDGTNIVGDA